MDDKKPIRILLVDDSPLILAVLKRILATASDFEVVGTAKNGKEGIEMRESLQPDMISTDFEMPVCTGLELVQHIMATNPLPILVVSSIVDDPNSDTVSSLLKAGAVDVFPKPTGGFQVDSSNAQEYLRKLRIIARVKTFKRHTLGSENTLNTLKTSKIALPTPEIIVIGTSTGGPQTLLKLFVGLKANFPAPIVCVQHISTGFLQNMVTWLNAQCDLTVKIAVAGETPQAGNIYFAPEGTHLKFDNQKCFALSKEPRDKEHCPSVDVSFHAVAEQFGKGALAILLTGMGKDGAEGITSIAGRGGTTIAQNEASSVVFGMPKEAIATGHVQKILSLGEIEELLKSFTVN
jgi:two-component system, chemotaxis family, protein-glutamate methylesterase/glutaminase